MFGRMKHSLSVALLVTFALLAVAVSPPAPAGAMSNYLINKDLDYILRAQSFSAPTSVYVALATSSGSAASCGTEVSGGSYARVAVASSLANWAGTQGVGTTTASTGTSGQTSNNNAITFPAPTANWGTVTSFCIFDALTSGNLLLQAALTVNKTINNGDAAPSFAAAALTWTISRNLRLQHRQRVYLASMPAGNEDPFDRRRAA